MISLCGCTGAITLRRTSTWGLGLGGAGAIGCGDRRGAALETCNRGQLDDPRFDRLQFRQRRRRLLEHQREAKQYRGPDRDR